MSDMTEDQPAEPFNPAEWPSEDGHSASDAADATPAGNPGSGALPPLFPPLPPIPGAHASDSGAPAEDGPTADLAMPDRDTDRISVSRAGHRSTLTPPPITDAETERLNPTSSVLDAETTRLDKRSALDIETQRLKGPRLAPEGGAERASAKRPAINIETERLAGTIPAPDPEAERLRRQQSGLDQQDTERLTHEQLLAQMETERLKRQQSIDQEDTERLKRAGASGGPPERSAPDAGHYPPTPLPSLTERLEDEEALQEEINTALLYFTTPMPVVLPPPITPSRPGDLEVAPVTPVFGTPEAPAPEPASGVAASGRPDESLVRALRREMFPRRSLGSRALALFSQPDVILMSLFVLAQVALLSVYDWNGQQPAEATALAQGSSVARGGAPGATFSGLSHLTGAPIWPVFASAAALAGLTGARVLAILCVAGAGVATARAARNLYGRAAGVFTAALLALSGPLIFIAHLATADHVALLGVAVSFWAITQASETRRNEWLLVAAAAFFIAVTAQFAALPLIIPLGLVALALRARPAYTIFSITGLVVVTILVSRFAPPPVSVFAIIFHRGVGSLSTSVFVSAAGLQLVALGVVAWGAAIAGWIATREQGRLAAALFTGLLLIPVSLALQGGALDTGPRIVPSLLFGAPLMGQAFATLWLGPERLNMARRVIAVILLLGVATVGLSQARGLTQPNQLRPSFDIHATWGKAAAPQRITRVGAPR
ncbi:MAG TPA: glycosyltransferase family 39 protein [Ktedonobacterales bacterium]